MKNKIIVRKGNNKLDFYLLPNTGKFYLFTQDYTKGVYKYFRSGKSENEVRSYKKWDKNLRLDKTIEKIPMYIHYVLNEAA